MQENTNVGVLFDVLKDSINFIEDDYMRGRLNKRVNNLMKSEALNIDSDIAINHAIDVKINNDRYSVDLISEQEFIENMKEFISQLELNTNGEPSVKGSLKRQGI